MNTPAMIAFAQPAILTLAEIKTAIEVFERGEGNAFDVLDAVMIAVEAYQAAVAAQVRREAA